MTKVSIIIATYNCGDLIRATLNSIRMGGWNEMEILVMDGASSDDTLKPVQDFPDLPIDVTCEPDDGQYDAINKGMAKATGDILCWINAGDIFVPGAINNAASAFEAIPRMKWLTGRQCVAEGESIRKISESVLRVSDLEIRLGLCAGGLSGHLQQEGMFWRRDLWEEAGPLDLQYSLAADFELWTRFARVTPLYRTRVPLAAFSYHETNRSISEGDRYREEVEAAVSRLPADIRKKRRWFKVAPIFWKACRRTMFLRDLSAIVFHCVPALDIHLIVFERKGSTFRPVCKNGAAWVK